MTQEVISVRFSSSFTPWAIEKKKSRPYEILFFPQLFPLAVVARRLLNLRQEIMRYSHDGHVSSTVL